MKRALLLLLAACGAHNPASEPVKLDLPSYAPRAPQAAPPGDRAPPPGEATPAPFPKPIATTLKNGLEVIVVRAPALPLVHVRVLVRAGMGYRQPGAASLTGDMLKDGGTRSMTGMELARRVEGLGADLSVKTGLDTTTISAAVTSPHWPEALAVLGEMVQAPRFDPRELDKGKARAADLADDRLRGSGHFLAMRAAFGAIYGDSPYGSYGALPSEIAKLNLATVRDFHKRFYVPKNAAVLVVGDVAPEDAALRVEKVFGAWSGEPPPKLDFPAPAPIAKRRVIVVNRKDSAESDVFVVGLAPPRADPSWPEVRVADQILGGAMAGRLFLDVREQRGLAYATRASIVELAHGEQPVVAYAGTRTEKTADCVSAILENLDRIARDATAPTEEETASARRQLSDARVETIGELADRIAEEWTMGLPLDDGDAYRALVNKVGARSAAGAAARTFRADRALIVVAGSADAIATSLARFGDVSVLDPERDFALQKTVPAQPQK